MKDKFLFMLGLCRKAGKIIIGTDLVTKSLPSGKTKLVIYAQNASLGTEKKITDKCSFYNITCIKLPFSSDDISRAIGKCGSVCVLGITDDNFSNELSSILTKRGTEYGT